MKFENYDGKLTKTGFIKGIEFISTWYPTLKFWQEDFNGQVEVRKSIWYDVFKKYSDEQFLSILQSYCDNNDFPPLSPSQLLSHYKEVILSSFERAEAAFEKVIYNFKIDFDIKKLYNFYEQKGKGYIASTIKQLQSEFELFRVGNIEVSYFKHNFCKIYNDLILKEVNTEKLKLGDKKWVMQF